jgi:serine/threonine protein kinase
MSPEQARGKAVDKRADIWAFGCVLYEMLTGRVPFDGETTSDTIGRILEREPDWSALPAATPVAIRRLLLRCLVKEARQRLRDIGDARIEIDAIGDVAPWASESAHTHGPATSRAAWLPWVAFRDAGVGCRRVGGAAPGGGAGRSARELDLLAVHGLDRLRGGRGDFP